MDLDRRPPIPVWVVLTLVGAVIVGVLALTVLVDAVYQTAPDPKPLDATVPTTHANPLHASRSHPRPTPSLSPAWHTAKPSTAPPRPVRSGVDWDAIAQCESSGHWADDTGNGYYGGLQEGMPFWRSYGGLTYAPRPDLATRTEQITVAERAYRVRGLSPWPTCGSRG